MVPLWPALTLALSGGAAVRPVPAGGDAFEQLLCAGGSAAPPNAPLAEGSTVVLEEAQMQLPPAFVQTASNRPHKATVTQIRELSVKELDVVPATSRIQALKNSSIQEFNVRKIKHSSIQELKSSRIQAF